MDESWRAPIGSAVPRRRAAEQWRQTGGSLGADDFRDVFGGPPLSVLPQNGRSGGADDLAFSCSSTPCFPSPNMDGKNRLRPPRGVAGVRGGEGTRGARWLVETEDDDAGLSAFASKLRPINVPPRRRHGGSPPPAVVHTGREHRSINSWAAPTGAARPDLPRLNDPQLEGVPNRPKFGGAPKHNRRSRPSSSPAVAVAAVEPDEALDHGTGAGGSPSPALSSIYDDVPMATIRPVGAFERLQLQELAKRMERMLENEGPPENFGFLGTSRGGKEVAEYAEETSGAVDDAIAWAKEKFLGSPSPSSEDHRSCSCRAGTREHELRGYQETEEERMRATTTTEAGEEEMLEIAASTSEVPSIFIAWGLR